MTNPPRFEHAEIVQQRSLSRSGVQRGPVGPCNRRDADQRALLRDREAAGRFCSSAASIVASKGSTLRTPQSLQPNKIGSVSACSNRGGLV